MKGLIIVLIVVVAVLAAVMLFKVERKTLVTIGTGGVTGVYYPTGGAIAQIVNKTRATHGIKVAFESTGGSVFNVNAVMSGDLDFGIVQSDRQYQAVNGIADWQDKGPQQDLRAICSLHPEAVTLVAAVDSGIETLDDLRGKRVNIGNPGSGQRGNAIDVLTTASIDWKSELKAEGLKAAECAKMLQDGRIDAFFYTVGHPAGAITEATAGKRKVRFVSITGMELLLEKYPYYANATIPAKLYPNAANKENTETVGVVTTFLTSVKVSEEVVYTVVKSLFENLEELKTLHPALEILSKKEMVESGLSAPIHAGALRYYREAGLMGAEE